VSRCVHPAYIAIEFETGPPGSEHFYCEVHDARTEGGPGFRRKFGWTPKQIRAVRKL
jgi:hypothetical protein